MGTMSVFLDRLDDADIRALYQDLDARWDGRAALLNARLEAAGLPARVANMSSIWTVYYTQPSRYNWMLQYYLRAEGLALSWVGTGRLIFSLNYTDEQFSIVADRFVAACEAMRGDGWWWSDDTVTNRSIKRQILRELVAVALRRPLPAPAQ
jgi:glutamate-1-semialdehyde 2,1-aminomutase